MKKYKDATPEQIKKWIETENKWWSDRAMKFVAIASVLQVVTICMMGAIMYGLDNIFGM